MGGGEGGEALGYPHPPPSPKMLATIVIHITDCVAKYDIKY